MNSAIAGRCRAADLLPTSVRPGPCHDLGRQIVGTLHPKAGMPAGVVVVAGTSAGRLAGQPLADVTGHRFSCGRPVPPLSRARPPPARVVRVQPVADGDVAGRNRRALPGTRGPRERRWAGRCPGLAGPARAPGLSVFRCGYDSSLTSPGSLIGHGPGSFADSAFASHSSGKCWAPVRDSGRHKSFATRVCAGQGSDDPFSRGRCRPAGTLRLPLVLL